MSVTVLCKPRLEPKAEKKRQVKKNGQLYSESTEGSIPRRPGREGKLIQLQHRERDSNLSGSMHC